VTESSDWVYNDASIKDGEVLYRRVAKDDAPQKNLFTTVDRVSGTRCLGKGAFTLTTPDKTLPNAGASVQIESLMKTNVIPTYALVDWETHGVGRFHVVDVRNGLGGVVAFEDPDDEILGKVHGLLRTKSPIFDRPEWSKIRSFILQAAVWFESDPGYEAESAS
jgi:hypothetical protein